MTASKKKPRAKKPKNSLVWNDQRHFVGARADGNDGVVFVFTRYGTVALDGLYYTVERTEQEWLYLRELPPAERGLAVALQSTLSTASSQLQRFHEDRQRAENKGHAKEKKQ